MKGGNHFIIFVKLLYFVIVILFYFILSTMINITKILNMIIKIILSSQRNYISDLNFY